MFKGAVRRHYLQLEVMQACTISLSVKSPLNYKNLQGMKTKIAGKVCKTKLHHPREVATLNNAADKKYTLISTYM